MSSFDVTLPEVNVKLVKFPHSPIILENKSVFPMAMFCLCYCFSIQELNA